jgi:hypothetical protein
LTFDVDTPKAKLALRLESLFDAATGFVLGVNVVMVYPIDLYETLRILGKQPALLPT